MSFEITTSFVKQYSANVQLLSQQKGSKLRGAVREEPITGEKAFFDQIGATTARRRTSRHADTPLISTPHARRMVIPYDYDWADLVDNLDKVKTLNDPTNEYALNAAYAMGRAMDDAIIAAFFSTAYTGADGTTSTSADTSTNQIAAASTGLTLSKLIAGKVALLGHDVDEDIPMFCAITAEQLGDLLGDSTLTSADYNSVKALVEGKIDTFLGIKFILCNRLLTDSSSYRRVPLWCKDGMLLAVNQTPTARITERADKNYATQVYYCQAIGATRMEEYKVVEIQCVES